MLGSFITGSYAYGEPTDKSDIDIVLRIGNVNADLLRKLSDKKPEPKGRKIVSKGPDPIRFGKINLILCLDDEVFECWRKGTVELQERARVEDRRIPRDEACEYFKSLRAYLLNS